MLYDIIVSIAMVFIWFCGFGLGLLAYEFFLPNLGYSFVTAGILATAAAIGAYKLL